MLLIVLLKESAKKIFHDFAGEYFLYYFYKPFVAKWDFLSITRHITTT